MGEKKSWITNLIFIKHIEDKGSELGGIPERKELLVNLLKPCSIQLATGAVFDEAFVPDHNKAEIQVIKHRSNNVTDATTLARVPPKAGLKRSTAKLFVSFTDKKISLIQSKPRVVNSNQITL